MNPPDIVLVEWIDAVQHKDPEDPDLGTPIYSLGFVIEDSARGLRLCPSYAPEASWDDYLDIPRAYIESVTPLGPA